MNADLLPVTKGIVEELGAGVSMVVADVSAGDAPKRIADACMALGGRIDCLINNAGIMSYTDARTITDEEFDRMIAINFKAPVRIMREVLPLMEKQGSGVRHQHRIVVVLARVGVQSVRRWCRLLRGQGGAAVPTPGVRRRTWPKATSVSTRSRPEGWTPRCTPTIATS